MKKVFISYIVLMLFVFIYCLPVNKEDVFEVVISGFVLSASSYMMIIIYKMMKWIGYNSLPILFIPSYKILPFLFSIPILIVAIISFIRTIFTKDFSLTYMILPSIFYCMNSYKIYHMKIYENL